MRFVRCSLACLGLLLVFSTPALAQAPDSLPPGWNVKSRMGLQVQQSQFSNSWRGDEQGTVSWAWTWISQAENQMKPWLNWLNTLETQFGQTHQQTADRDAWEKPRKSADKITYRGMVRFTAGAWIDPFVALDFDSQFYAELDSLGVQKTAVLNPMTITATAGIARTVYETPSKRLITRLGFGSKSRIDRLHFDDTTLAIDTRRASEAGFEWFNTGRWATAEDRSVFLSELRMFKAIVTNEPHDAERDHWSQVDVDWQNTLSTKVMSYVEFVLFWQIRYEAQEDLRGQFKQTLGAGLTWELM